MNRSAVLALFTFAASMVCVAQAPEALTLTGAFSGTHDPSIGEDLGKYYLFATGAVFPHTEHGSDVPPPPSPDGEPAKKMGGV